VQTANMFSSGHVATGVLITELDRIGEHCTAAVYTFMLRTFLKRHNMESFIDVHLQNSRSLTSIEGTQAA
jgi:hypothetical protein